MKKIYTLMLALAYIIAGIASIVKAQDSAIAPLETVLGVAIAVSNDSHDCEMLRNLTDLDAEDVTCAYTFLSSSAVMSASSKYAKFYSLDLTGESAVYDAKFRKVGNTLIGVRKSDTVSGLYAILISKNKE